MHGLVIKKRQLNNKLLSRDIAELLFGHALYGKIVVVTNNPAILHSTVRKRWQHMIRRLQVDRSRTLRHDKLDGISDHLYFARRVSFSSKPIEDYLLAADVTFMSPNDCARIAPSCRTLYVTCDVPREMLHLMAAWMPRNSEVVLYEQR